MGADLTAAAAHPIDPLVSGIATGEADTPLPLMVGVPIQAAGTARAVIPVVQLITDLIAARAQTPFPSMSEQAQPMMAQAAAHSLSLCISHASGRVSGLGLAARSRGG